MKSSHFSRNLLSILSLFILIFMAACSSSTNTAAPQQQAPTANAKEPEGPKSGGTLIIGMESEADMLDPHRAGGWVTMRVNNQMYEPLIGEDLSKTSAAAPVPDLIPVLAERWDVSDVGTVYTFYLRQNVQFHDGSLFDADAVEFNVRRLTDKEFEYYDKMGAGRTFRTWKYYKDVKVVDPHTVQIELTAPFSEFPRMLAQINSLQIVSPAVVKSLGNDGLGENPSGTGPFKFEERVRGQKISMVKNENYWGTKPYLDRVIFRPLSDPAARVLAIQNNEVDIIAVPPPDSFENLEKQGFNIISGTPPHVWYMSFNFVNDIMKSKEVRQAINYAIDREGIANQLLKGTVHPAYTMQSPGNPVYDPNLKFYEYNPAKAKELLAQAGYPNGFKTKFMTSVDSSGQLLPVPMAEWIQRNLAEVGIEVELVTGEWISYLANYNSGMPEDVGMNQMSSGRTTPFFLAMISHSSFKAPGGFNSGQYLNPELDQVMDQAAASTNPAQAFELWKKAEEMIMEDAAYIPVVNDSAPYVVSPNVKGFVVPAEQWYTLTPVWIE